MLFAKRSEIDVIVLAESPFEGNIGIPGFDVVETTIAANQKTLRRLEIYYRSTVTFSAITVAGRAIIADVRPVSNNTIHLVAAHLPALYTTPEQRDEVVKILAADIKLHEAKNGHERTLLVGDLNCDPHDFPITQTCGLNAVPSKMVAQSSKKRKCLGVAVPYFYNPMWAHQTDATNSPPGTYFYDSGKVDNRFWYTYDQVMLRSALISAWQDADLEVLTRIGKMSLLDKGGTPNKAKFSDHLPLSFSLTLP